MARRTVVVRTIPGPGEPDSASVELGRLIDDGGVPFGSNPNMDEILRGDPRGQFEKYHKGYSNGYVEYVAA